MADWKLEKWPLGAALETLGDVSITLKDALLLAASFFAVLYKEALLPGTQQAVTIRCLEQLARRKGGIKGIRALVEVLPKLFGLNVVGSEQAVKVIRYWLANAEKHRFEI